MKMLLSYSMRRHCRKLGLVQWLLGAAIVANIFVYLHLACHKPESLDSPDQSQHAMHDQIIPGSLTFIFREFEEFENLVGEAARRAHHAYPEGKIVVVSDQQTYPPLQLPVGAITHTLQPALNTTPTCLASVLRSEFVMLLPDGCDVMSQEAVDLTLSELTLLPSDYQLLAWSAFALPDLSCQALQVDMLHWSLLYHRHHSNHQCNIVKGNFVLLLRTEHFLQLARPFERPMADSVFIQTAAKGWKVHITRSLTFRSIGELFNDGHNRWKHQLRDVERQRALYHTLGVKYVRTADGTEEWHGCTKTSERCFPTIIQDMPQYLYEGRWTPPCCLKALRSTARHVFTILEAEGVRYWLEGGSLLGVARSGDIIPWDYDVDIGIYQEDAIKSRYLYRLRKNNFEDDQGFVWTKSHDGEYYQVQFSQTNHLRVDIFPFIAKDGIMTRTSYIPGHKQDRPFPEHFLEPLEKLNFVGMQAYVPNNHKQFLELKFGKGVIDNPSFPHNITSKDIVQ